MTSSAAVAAVTDTYLERLGIVIWRSGHDRVVGKMTIGPDHLDHQGVVHGAVLLVFAEELAEHGASMAVGKDWVILTLETKANYFRRCQSSVRGGSNAAAHWPIGHGLADLAV